jgi:multidrug efflux pump subunit AcrA (membrane-fusion protein)
MEYRATLKILATVLVLIGILWYGFSEIAKFKQAEIEKAMIVRDTEIAKSETDNRAKTIEQEKAKSLRLEKLLAEQKRLLADAARQLDQEKQQDQEDRARLDRAQTQLEAEKTIQDAPAERTTVKEVPKIVEKQVPIFVPRPVPPVTHQAWRRPLLAARPRCTQWSYFRVGYRSYRYRR